jgi:hypothetical protein
MSRSVEYFPNGWSLRRSWWRWKVYRSVLVDLGLTKHDFWMGSFPYREPALRFIESESRP